MPGGTGEGARRSTATCKCRRPETRQAASLRKFRVFRLGLVEQRDFGARHWMACAGSIRDAEIGIGIEPLYEFLALMIEITADIEAGVWFRPGAKQ